MIKQSLILLAIAALCSAEGGYHSKKSALKAPSQYASVASFHSSKPTVTQTERIQGAEPAAPSPYAFGYEAEGSSRQESSDASGKVSGSYKVVNEDGSVRIVKYVADEQGFRADIDTNEPGTKSDNPADVTLKSAAIEKAAPAKKYGSTQSFSQQANMYEQKPAMFSAPLQGSAPSRYGQISSFQQQQQVRQYSVPAMQQAPIRQPSQFSAAKPAPYSFSYDAQLEDGSSSRIESADASGKVVGQYSLATADGRQRLVKYEADHEGFRASVDSNEFGDESPARTQYPSAAPVAPQRFSAPIQANTYSMQQNKLSGVKTFQAPAMSYQGQSSIQYNAPAYEKPSPYAFNYAADLEDGTMSRTESADGSGKVVGSYSLYVADGRQRKVDYIATPEEGFKATVTTNEFGTDPNAESPADVKFYSSASMEEPKPYSSPNAYRPQTRAAASSAGVYSQSAIAQQPIQFNMGPGNAGYSYNYQTSLEDGGRSTQSETADGSGKVTGYYSMSIPDGRQRKVDYTADAAGFQASIDTNEFGTKSDSPSHVSFLSSAPQVAAEAPRQPVAFKAPSAPQFNMQDVQGMYRTSFGTENRIERVQSVQPVRQVQLSPYSFNYEAEASGGSSSRRESSDANGAVTGSYEVRNEDGSVRVVEYIADKDGFRANVKTNELGTKSDNPADVILNSDAPAVSSLPLQQEPAPARSAPFPLRSYTSKTNMVTQQKVDGWRR